jgi:hypothetical protein
MSLATEILNQLEVQNLKLDRFREIVTRLFAVGIIIRDEDAVEQRFYDDARRIEPILDEYFSLAGFHLVHDLQNEFFRLYAPGAPVPGMEEDGYDPVPGLRARLSVDFVAAALALRFQYQQGLVEGGSRLTDAGEVLIRFDDLAAAMQTQIKRPLPESAGDRYRLLKDLKRHRIIQYGATFTIDDEDALIAIRPSILGIISEDALAAALEAEGAPETIAEATDTEEVAE